MEFSFFIFKGDKEKIGEKARVRDYGAHIRYVSEKDLWKMNIGLSYISSMAESETLQDVVAGSLNSRYTKKIPAFSSHLMIDYSFIHFVFEMLQSTKRFVASDLAFRNHGAKIAAFNSELALDFTLWKESFDVGIAFQKTDEALAAFLPKTRISSVLRWKMHPKTSLAFELLVDNDYGLQDCVGSICGTGNRKEQLLINWKGYF